MNKRPFLSGGWLSPLLVALAGLLLWAGLSAARILSPLIFPSPAQALKGFGEVWGNHRLLDDIVASLWRVSVGCALAILLGVPLGLWMGRRLAARQALLPAVNFFRNLSPIAWFGFAAAWFGIGDRPAIFLIFMGTFFSLVMTTQAAVATVPQVYFRVAQEYGITGREALTRVVLPAILPQLITAIRIMAGIAWVVVVAAEMLAGKDGLGYAIQDDRNSLRFDLLVVHMIVIGLVGVLIDRALSRLTQMESVRWSYER